MVENRNNKQGEIKRLFFGVEIHSPWPQQFPAGRMIDESCRHLTLAFLGNIPFDPLSHHLENISLPLVEIGTCGYFDECLLLPPRHANVVAWHATWWDDGGELAGLQSALSNWLSSLGYLLDNRPWKPHATLCRKPFDGQRWMKTFKPLPFFTGSIHLYESTGNLNYFPIWSYPIRPPIEEIEHTADTAFLIRGRSVEQMFYHAFAALAFKAPDLLGYLDQAENIKTLDDVIIALNGVICRADAQIGCPMKAVSFHGEINELSNNILEWEMIIDV